MFQHSHSSFQKIVGQNKRIKPGLIQKSAKIKALSCLKECKSSQRGYPEKLHTTLRRRADDTILTDQMQNSSLSTNSS